MPTAKLRFLNIRRSMIGDGATSSRTIKPMKPALESTAHQTIILELNQSSSWPLSSMICKLASQTLSRPNPI